MIRVGGLVCFVLGGTKVGQLLRTSVVSFHPCGNFSDTSSLKLLKTKGSIGHTFTVCNIRSDLKNVYIFTRLKKLKSRKHRMLSTFGSYSGFHMPPTYLGHGLKLWRFIRVKIQSSDFFT